MLDEKFTKTLEQISKKLAAGKITWALVGSTNMALQGIDVQPHDIDIAMKQEDLSKIEELFSEYGSPKIKEIRFGFGGTGDEIKVRINNTEIQFFAERESSTYWSKILAKRTISIRAGSVTVPCLTLEAEAQAYSETNRENKSRLIREYLKGKEDHSQGLF